MPLYEQHCITDSLPHLLTKDQIESLLIEVSQWKINHDGKSIIRKFKFIDYYQTLKFINSVANIINQENHHPDINFGYNTCTISFSTHSAGGITLFDIICAAHIDKLFSTADYNV